MQIVLIWRTVPGFDQIIDSVNKVFNTRVNVEMIDFPMTRSFRSERKQYDADVLLKELRRNSPYTDRTIFILREDIFAKPLNFVFGFTSNNACIVSTARLDPRFYGEGKDTTKANKLFKERIVKEILHELGHTFALPHCDNKKCVMIFSNSISDVDFKGKEFCERCSKALYLKPSEK